MTAKDSEVVSEEPTVDVEAVEKEKVALHKQLEETQGELAEVKKEQRKREFIEKAGEFSELGSADQIGALLEAADEHFGETEQVFLSRLLKGATEQVKKGALFTRLSKDADDAPATWEEKLDRAARERVARGDAKTTEIAKVAIMHEDRELRKERQQSMRS